MAYAQVPAAPPVVVVNPPSDWSSSVFDCFSDFGNCVDVYFCYCCANARQWDAADGRADSMNMLIFCANFCLGTVYCLNCMVRCNVAQKYNIDEGNCMSCLCGTFLFGCTMCQQHRELTARGVWPGGTICAEPPATYVAIPNPNPMGNTGTGVFSTNNPGLNQQLIAGSNQMYHATNQGVAAMNQALNQPYQQQPPPPGGYQQQPPPPGGYQQQPPPPGGYQQQPPPPGGNQQQAPPPAYNQPPPGGYQQQPPPQNCQPAPAPQC